MTASLVAHLVTCGVSALAVLAALYFRSQMKLAEKERDDYRSHWDETWTKLQTLTSQTAKAVAAYQSELKALSDDGASQDAYISELLAALSHRDSLAAAALVRKHARPELRFSSPDDVPTAPMRANPTPPKTGGSGA